MNDRKWIWLVRIILLIAAIAAEWTGRSELASGCVIGLVVSFLVYYSEEN